MIAIKRNATRRFIISNNLWNAAAIGRRGLAKAILRIFCPRNRQVCRPHDALQQSVFSIVRLQVGLTSSYLLL
jgi:hypothetical protein